MIDPASLAALASNYARSMTSIRGRRVQRLIRREFAGADRVQVEQGEGDAPGVVVGVAGGGAASCRTDGTGPFACVVQWRHGEREGVEQRFDLLKDSLPLLSSRPVALDASQRAVRR